MSNLLVEARVGQEIVSGEPANVGINVLRPQGSDLIKRESKYQGMFIMGITTCD
ncbi:MAG: hypothetical protein JXB26_20250 [Candidatus Aminicenantes bacterium]|nr:hypothetical protein [Candidatus Aminicenantes bacterium]